MNARGERPGRAAWVVVAVASLVGSIASFVLAVEKFLLLRNPFRQATCTINDDLDCTAVMSSLQAEIFGFPNPLLGIGGFAVMFVLGVVTASGFALPRVHRWLVQLGVLLGVGFVHWLMWQSLVVLDVLCPYCMVVWVAMIVTTVFTTAQLWSASSHRLGSRWGVWLADHAVLVAASWLLVIAVPVLLRLI